jgi:hypothetical protein
MIPREGSNAASSHACAIADPCMGSWTPVGERPLPSGIRGGTRTSASTARAAWRRAAAGSTWLVIAGERASHTRESAPAARLWLVAG